jgi:hypothetical protein
MKFFLNHKKVNYLPSVWSFWCDNWEDDTNNTENSSEDNNSECTHLKFELFNFFTKIYRF